MPFQLPLINRRIWIALALVGVLAPVLAGQLVGFPSMDDGWISLLVKESGRQAIQGSIHRRAMMELLFAAYRSPVVFKWIGIVSSVGLWGVMALETGALWRLLFPEWRQYAIAAGCLSVAPVIVETQLTTLVTTIPIGLPTALGYAALLLAWRYVDHGHSWHAALAGGATVAGFIVSEYAWAPALAAGVFLTMLFFASRDPAIRRRGIIALTGLVLCAGVGFAVFFSSADYAHHPTVQSYTPGGAVSSMFRDPLDLAIWIPNTIWRAVVGGCAVAFSSIRFSWQEKSTLAGSLYGCVFGILLVFACGRSVRDGSEHDSSSPVKMARLLALAVALIVALAPEYARQGIFIAGREHAIEAYSTRFYTTALPVAACLTTSLLLMLVRVRARAFAVFLLGLLIGNSLFLEAYGEYRKQSQEYVLGPLLRPYVESHPGLTVAVLPDYLGREYEVIFKATSDWPADLSRRLLILYEGRMPVLLHRTPERSGACENLRVADVMLGPALSRHGAVRMLWVDGHVDGRGRKDGSFNIEPYCVPSLLPPGSLRESPLTSAIAFPRLPPVLNTE